MDIESVTSQHTNVFYLTFQNSKFTPKRTFFKSERDSFEIHFHTLFCLQFKGLRNIHERYKDNYDQNGCKAD